MNINTKNVSRFLPLALAMEHDGFAPIHMEIGGEGIKFQSRKWGNVAAISKYFPEITQWQMRWSTCQWWEVSGESERYGHIKIYGISETPPGITIETRKVPRYNYKDITPDTEMVWECDSVVVIKV